MKYITTLVLLVPFCLFAQEHQYSYSFSGEMDSIFVEDLSLQISKIEGVKEAKGRYKVEKGAGEIFIYTIESKNEHNQTPFSPTKVKEIFIKNRRSEEHTSELQSRPHLVCRLLLEKKKKKTHEF